MVQTHKRISAFTKESKHIARVDVDQTPDTGDTTPKIDHLLIDIDGVFVSGANDRTIKYLLAQIEDLKK